MFQLQISVSAKFRTVAS